MKYKKRRILVVTGSRGEYGYIRPLLREIKASRRLEAEVLATNMHLLPEFGSSVNELRGDGVRVDHSVYMALAGYTNASMAKSLGVFLMSVTDILNNRPPDVILIAGDRGEQLMAAVAGAHMNIPVAHVQAGELSGNVDGLSRHAIARFAHIHFAANEDARRRLIRSGEEPSRVFMVGAPQLDDFVGGATASRAEIAKRFSLDLGRPLVLVVQHPVTEQAALAGQQMEATLRAVISLGHQALVVYPNNDAGSTAVQRCIQERRDANVRVERNVPRAVYGGLLKAAAVIVGNSSSGIIEAPLFGLPAVNIGRRQAGRFQGKNVINVPRHEPKSIEAAIRRALSASFRRKLRGQASPYGDGRSARRIIRLLESVPLDEKLLLKKMTY